MTRPATLTFDGQAYEVEALQKAAYRFIDRLSAEISVDASNIVCVLRWDKPLGDDDQERAVQNFRKEVLDQQLRLRLKRETAQERNLILSLAFSRTGLQSLE